MRVALLLVTRVAGCFVLRATVGAATWGVSKPTRVGRASRRAGLTRLLLLPPLLAAAVLWRPYAGVASLRRAPQRQLASGAAKRKAAPRCSPEAAPHASASLRLRATSGALHARSMTRLCVLLVNLDVLVALVLRVMH